MKSVKPLVFNMSLNPEGWDIHFERWKIVGESGGYLHCYDPLEADQMTLLGDPVLRKAYEAIKGML